MLSREVYQCSWRWPLWHPSQWSTQLIPTENVGSPVLALRRVLAHSLRYCLVSGKPCSVISMRYLMRTCSSSGVNHDICLSASFHDSLPAIHWQSVSQLTPNFIAQA